MRILEHKVHGVYNVTRMIEFLDEFNVEYYMRVDRGHAYLDDQGIQRYTKVYVFNEIAEMPTERPPDGWDDGKDFEFETTGHPGRDGDCGCHGHE